MGADNVVRGAEAGAFDRWDGPNVRQAAEMKVAAIPLGELEQLQNSTFEEAREQGLAEGREAGRQQGLEEGRSEARQLANALRAACYELGEPLAAHSDQVCEELVKLAMATARHVLRRELKTEPGHVVGVVRDALAMLPLAISNIRVRLHPKDAGLVDDSFAADDEQRNWKIIEDPLLTRGGCVIETESARIDARIESQVGRVLAGIHGDERGADR